MAESIPPLAELGLVHVVPPIDGRSTDVGYIVRVVATNLSTTVTWKNADGTVSGTSSLTRGEFVTIDTIKTMQALLVKCSKPCVVMQYNKGKYGDIHCAIGSLSRRYINWFLK